MPKTSKQMVAEADAAVPRITSDEAKSLHGQPGVVFVDLREPPEVAASGKVPGALAIPRGLLEFRADPEGASADPALTGAKTVVTYCASGGRAALAGKTLKEMGFSDVRNLGGFKDWTEAGGRVEKG
ncbi:MAG: rhodanese-like domain-containing protein [Acetobacteraceae bacterium]|nr:rhodanese-like domain-containing protein [Acetobacteraceae bacterium]